MAIETEIFTLIGNFGFPIVAFYLMYVMANKTIKQNTDAVNNLVIHLKSERKD